jgi:flagellar assembly factor FliW
MNSMEATETRPATSPADRAESVIRMPLGLLGLEQLKRFTLQANPEEDSFLWLKVQDEPKMSFLVLSPFVVLPTYEPEIPDEDEAFLDLQDPQDTLILNIVTMHGSQQATINLKGPIVLNRRTLVAKQVIPLNAPDYSVAYPLPVQAN